LLEVDRLAFGFEFLRALFGGVISARDDDGMPQRAITSSRPPEALRTIGAG
jgi:hypothetical protein